MVEPRYLSFLIGSRNVSLQKMIDAFLLSSDELRKRFLDKFSDSGLIGRCSRYTYRATNWVMLEPENIVAVKAKLSKWNEVLMQAPDYRIFADYCYIALDSEHWKDEHRSIFEPNGVILVFENEIKIRLESRRLSPGEFRVVRDILLRQGNKWRPVRKIWGDLL